MWREKERRGRHFIFSSELAFSYLFYNNNVLYYKIILCILPAFKPAVACGNIDKLNHVVILLLLQSSDFPETAPKSQTFEPTFFCLWRHK